MIKAIIFDFDGVIVDSEGLVSQAYEQVVRSYGREPDLRNGKTVHLVGLKGDTTWPILKEKYNINEKTEILMNKTRELYNLLLPKAELMPGFEEILKKLKKTSLKLAVATSSRKNRVEVIFNKFKLWGEFDLVITMEDCKKLKPDPEIYLTIAKRLELYPNQCLVIEDTETGVMAGKNAGMFVVAKPNKYTISHDFLKADRVINSFSELRLEDLNS